MGDEILSRPQSSLWASLGLHSSETAREVTGHGCRPWVVFQKFGHTLSYSHPEKECHPFRQRCTCTPAEWAGHSKTGLSFHWALSAAIGTVGAEGSWVISFIAPASSVGGLIKDSLNINPASETFVLPFLQQWLCGPVSLPLTDMGPQPPSRERKSKQSDWLVWRKNKYLKSSV